jgi:hypothetical protein
MKVIGFARVSTAEQASGGISLEVQEAKIRAYCDLHDLDLVEVIIDGGESAKFRWWGRCPSLNNGQPCGQRVLKLYLPPGLRYLGCRACHGPTYRSVQKHDARVDRLLKDPRALEAMMITSMDLPLVKTVRRMSLLTDALIKLDRRIARRQAKSSPPSAAMLPSPVGSKKLLACP